MKTYLIAILSIVHMLSFLSILPLQAREVYPLNDGWQFFMGYETSSDGARSVMLPHTWNQDAASGARNYYRGTGNYSKEIDVPASWRGKRVFIKGYGANSVCHVFVNGRLAGEHRGGYTAFCHEITRLLKPGQRNFLRIMVSNARELDVLPTAGDVNVYGGLFREMELIVTGDTAIDPGYYGSQGVSIKTGTVTADRVDAHAVVVVSGVADDNAVVSVIVKDSVSGVKASAERKVKITAGKSVSVSVPFSVDDPRLWNGVRDPYLYNIEVSVTGRDDMADRVNFNTGFRSVEAVPGKGLSLNGETCPLRGVVVHQDRPLVGNALHKCQIEQDIALIVGMGANAVRVARGAHHPYFYELCDRHGLLVWNDFPVQGDAYLADKGYIDSESYRTNAIQQARETVYQLYNHPSVVMWGIFSNIHTREDNPVEFLKQLNAATRGLDNSRPTVASSNNDGDINFITDLISWDHHFGWKEGQPSDVNMWKRHLRTRWSELSSAVSYGAGGSAYQQSDSLSRPDWQGAWHPERWHTYLHEEYLKSVGADSMFWGIFVANMFDYGASGYPGGYIQGVNDMGLVTFDRTICKDAYYLYKAVWNGTEPFVYIAERRWDVRVAPSQTIKVYSNMQEPGLFINGIPQGPGSGSGGIFIWKDMELVVGKNEIEVVAGGLADRVIVEVRPAPGGIFL